MSRFLVYTPPAAGHVFPLVPGLQRLRDRGHQVQVRTGAHLIDHARAAGLDAVAVDPRIDASVKRSGSGDNIADLLARSEWEITDLRAAIAQWTPDALLVDTNTFGAATLAQTTGLPWAITLPTVLTLRGRGIPPYGLGLTPGRGPLTSVRDAVLWKVVELGYGRMMLPGLNPLRAGLGLPTLSNALDYHLQPDRLIGLTGSPLEYPRHDLPAHVRLVGGTSWDPPTEAPTWLTEPGDPWVLVTCSTHYQADEALAVCAVEALRAEPFRVLVTLADAYDTITLPTADNVRVERFVPHGPVLRQAAAVICPSGMGIISKAVAAGVPVVAVPFGRDQPEVARRVQQAGGGVILPRRRLDAGRLRAAVAAAMAQAPRAREIAAGLDQARAADAFADAAEELTSADETQAIAR